MFDFMTIVPSQLMKLNRFCIADYSTLNSLLHQEKDISQYCEDDSQSGRIIEFSFDDTKTSYSFNDIEHS